jgi:non-ribosomal peptide synthetase component F
MLARLTYIEELYVAVADANRLDERCNEFIGFSINLLLVPARLSVYGPFARLARDASRTALVLHSIGILGYRKRHNRLMRPVLQASIKYQMSAED